jgi:hypothetical protein
MTNEADLEKKPLDGSPPDETDISLKAYLSRISDERLRQCKPGWTDRQVIQ